MSSGLPLDGLSLKTEALEFSFSPQRLISVRTRLMSEAIGSGARLGLYYLPSIDDNKHTLGGSSSKLGAENKGFPAQGQLKKHI